MMREKLDREIDLIEMAAFNEGFEACMNALDEMSNWNHNNGYSATAEILRNAVKELRGENA